MLDLRFLIWLPRVTARLRLGFFNTDRLRRCFAVHRFAALGHGWTRIGCAAISGSPQDTFLCSPRNLAARCPSAITLHRAALPPLPSRSVFQHGSTSSLLRSSQIRCAWALMNTDWMKVVAPLLHGFLHGVGLRGWINTLSAFPVASAELSAPQRLCGNPPSRSDPSSTSPFLLHKPL